MEGYGTNKENGNRWWDPGIGPLDYFSNSRSRGRLSILFGLEVNLRVRGMFYIYRGNAVFDPDLETDSGSRNQQVGNGNLYE